MPPKILVGCPTSFHKEYCLVEYAKAIKSLSYPNFDILLVDNSPDDSYLKKIKEQGLPAIKGPYFEGARDRIIASRNILRQKAIDEGYDYFFSLEQDVIPSADIIQNLLKHKKTVICGVYFTNNVVGSKKVLIPLVYKLLDKETLSMRPLNDNELWEFPGLMKIVSAGLGCLLIHKSILERIKFRYDKNTFDDRWFFIDLYDMKVEPFADSTIKCKHLISQHQVWDDIRK